jgi:hypothetical protein
MSWHFTDGTTRITIKDGVMNYGNINLHAYKGILNGAVIHDFSQPGTYRLTFLPDAKGIQFEDFLPELQAKKAKSTSTACLPLSSEKAKKLCQTWRVILKSA